MREGFAMPFNKFAGAFALAAVVVAATPAMADDPNDPTMRSAAAKARDRAIIKRLNEDQLRYVQQRDAEYAKGWAAYRNAPRENARRQADYEREMARWRHAVKMCESGRHEYCSR